MIGHQVKPGRPCLYLKRRVSVRKELLTQLVSVRGHSKGGFPAPTFVAALWREGSWFPNQGSNPRPLQWKDGIWFPELSGRSKRAFFTYSQVNDLSQEHAEK